MANRLEKNGPDRERTRIKAQLAELNRIQREVTAGKGQTVNEQGQPTGQLGMNVGRSINQGVGMATGNHAQLFNNLGFFGTNYGSNPYQSFNQAPQQQGGINPNLAFNSIYGGNRYVSGGSPLGINAQSSPGGQQQGNGEYGGFMNKPWVQAGLGALSFAGSAYDIGRGLEEPSKLNAEDYYNPQYGRALSEYNKGLGLLADRRYDPTAELQDVERQGGIYNQALRNTGNIGAGALRNYLAAGSTRQQQQRGGIFTKKQNLDLGYMGEEAQGRFGAAQGLGQLGAQRAATDFSIADWNERSAAGRRNILGQGLSNLGLGAQTQQLMANQRGRDEQMMPYINSYGGGQYYAGQYGPVFGGQGMNQQQNRNFARGYGRG